MRQRVRHAGPGSTRQARQACAARQQVASVANTGGAQRRPNAASGRCCSHTLEPRVASNSHSVLHHLGGAGSTARPRGGLGMAVIGTQRALLAARLATHAHYGAQVHQPWV